MTTFLLDDTATIEEALRLGSAHLREIGIGSGNIEAAMLLSMVTGLDRLSLINFMARSLSPSEYSSFMGLMQRRSKREPLQHLTGRVEFMGLEFEVNADVLIPRPDTEILVEHLLDAEEEQGAREGLTIADVGTGSGAIAVSLASYLRYAHLIATELSEPAAAVARANMERHGVGNRMEIRIGDGLETLEGLEGKLDYLVSNPPYIPEKEMPGLDPEVRDYEPHMALTPGSDDLHWYRRLATEGARFLKHGGVLAVEVGMGQAPAVRELLEAAGRWEDIQSSNDLGGIERVVSARLK